MSAECTSADRILELGFAFRSSKALLSAVELDLFAALGDDALECGALADRIGIHARGARDFFDALVALELLDRDAADRYSNRQDCARYLDRRSPDCIGGLFEHLNSRIYGVWGRLTQALRTGLPQSGALGDGGYHAHYANKATFDQFLGAMAAGSLLPARMLAEKFPWSDYQTFVDIGTAQGCVPVEIARAHPHLTGGGFDLPGVEAAFTGYVTECGLSARLKFCPGDFLKDQLPRADVLIMGRILHNWDLLTKKMLLRKAHDALSAEGAIIIYDPFVDGARSSSHGLLASLTMLLETAAGFEYGAAECGKWLEETGFRVGPIAPLGTCCMAIVGYKKAASTVSCVSTTEASDSRNAIKPQTTSTG